MKKTKEERKQMGEKKKLKRMTFLTSLITLVSFLYKAGLGFLTRSLVLLIASISTLMVFICKVVFVKNVLQTREKKKKAYLKMAIAILVYAFIFIAFVVLKVNGIDISNDKTYSGIIGSLLILFMLIMFILSIRNLKGALEKSDIMVIGLKEMVFVSALADLVIIEEYISRIILEYKTIDILLFINNYFSLAIGILMVIVGIIMIIRFARYKVNKGE
ncbi:MAG: hypothetical protein J5691_05585 [Bacilli bacterium]|nr:hypothetical protein [Bacilli bacterium]